MHSEHRHWMVVNVYLQGPAALPSAKGSSVPTEQKAKRALYHRAGVHNSRVRSAGRLDIVCWRLIFLGPPYGSGFMSLSGAKNFEMASIFLENMRTPLTQRTQNTAGGSSAWQICCLMRDLRKLFHSSVVLHHIYVQNDSQIYHVLYCVHVIFHPCPLLTNTRARAHTNTHTHTHIHIHTHWLSQHFEVIHHATTTTIHVYEI